MSIPRRIFRAVFRPAVGIVVLVIVAGLLVVKLMTASSARRKATNLPVTTEASTANPGVNNPQRPPEKQKTVTQEFGQKIANFVLPPDAPKSSQPEGPPPIPEDVQRRFVNLPNPISLFPPRANALAAVAAATQPKLPPTPPAEYLPSFRLIRCLLITSPQTNGVASPLIGIVLENQYNIDANGVRHLVIPAGVEVHGTASPSPIRDRVSGEGDWTFVWRTADEKNGTELRVPATVLTRDYDEDTRVFGPNEKSPGLIGRRFQSFSEVAIKEALLEAISATVRSLKSYDPVLNPLTNQTINQEQPSAKNAAISGLASGADRLSSVLDDMRKQIDEKGYYLAVLPGKEFYLYTKIPVDLRNAHTPQSPPPAQQVQLAAAQP